MFPESFQNYYRIRNLLMKPIDWMHVKYTRSPLDFSHKKAPVSCEHREPTDWL